jgi:hypothetical protein
MYYETELTVVNDTIEVEVEVILTTRSAQTGLGSSNNDSQNSRILFFVTRCDVRW